MKYRFILEHGEYSVKKWAERLQVERAGYYAWLKSREARQDQEERIKELIRNAFEESRGT